MLIVLAISRGICVIVRSSSVFVWFLSWRVLYLHSLSFAFYLSRFGSFATGHLSLAFLCLGPFALAHLLLALGPSPFHAPSCAPGGRQTRSPPVASLQDLLPSFVALAVRLGAEELCPPLLPVLSLVLF